MRLAPLPEHEDHQLEPLPLQEPLPIGRVHEGGAEAVKEVLHHLHLVQAPRLATLVVGQGLQENVRSLPLPEEPLVGLVPLEEDGQDLRGVELVGVVGAHAYPLEEPGEEALLPGAGAHLGALEFGHVLDDG